MQNAIDLVHALGLEQPKVAILSAMETVNPQVPSTIEAAALCKMADRGQITGGMLDGPLALDNAIDLGAAQIKKIASPVAGHADILVVPDLEAGNMLAKSLTFMAGADAAGIVLGARVPIILTSRADSVTTRLASCAVAALVANARRESAKRRWRDDAMRSWSSTRARRASSSRCSLQDGRRPRTDAARPGRRHLTPSRTSSAKSADGRRRSTARVAPKAGARPRRRARASRGLAARRRWRPSLAGVGHRVVHGGAQYSAPVRIDARCWHELEQFVPLAPLHQPHNLAPIRLMLEAGPTLPQVACFDTAFHRTQPELAQMFALPQALHDEGVLRYGFHGLSYEYIAWVLPRLDPEAAPAAPWSCHLGNGVSMCALSGGSSVASTMGFTALDGLPMGTRCGELDPGVVMYLWTSAA